MPSAEDLLVTRFVWANTKPAVSVIKPSAVVDDTQPGPAVCVLMYATPRSSSIPRLERDRYSKREAIAKVAGMAAQINVNRGLLITIARRASPLKAKLTAVLHCIGGRLGVTLIRKAEWTAHPTRTTDPSRMASAPHTAPVILGKVMPGNLG
jgi:hypothetical protein